MNKLAKRLVRLGLAAGCLGPAVYGCARPTPDPTGHHLMPHRPTTAPRPAPTPPGFVETRDRALDRMSDRLTALGQAIARVRGEISARAVEQTSTAMAGLAAASHRLERQRQAATQALYAARNASAEQWSEIKARVEGHLRTTQASFDAIAAHLADRADGDRDDGSAPMVYGPDHGHRTDDARQ